MRVSRPIGVARQREVVLQREIENLSCAIARATTDAVITRLLSFFDETDAELATLTASLACAPISPLVLDPMQIQCSGVRLSLGLWRRR